MEKHRELNSRGWLMQARWFKLSATESFLPQVEWALHPFFFFLSFWWTHVLFWGPLVPLFWISGDVSSGFQSQSGFCLIRYFCRGECNVHSPRFTSGATLADLLAAGAQPVTSPHACAEVGLGSDSNVQPLCIFGLLKWELSHMPHQLAKPSKYRKQHCK